MANAGMGIYLGASIVDHSFKPNAVATFDGPKISITLIEDLPDVKVVDWSRVHLIILYFNSIFGLLKKFYILH